MLRRWPRLMRRRKTCFCFLPRKRGIRFDPSLHNQPESRP